MSLTPPPPPNCYLTTNMILTDIISTVTGREHGSFRWKVQYLCKNVTDLKINITFEDYIISILITSSSSL